MRRIVALSNPFHDRGIKVKNPAHEQIGGEGFDPQISQISADSGSRLRRTANHTLILFLL